MEGRKREQNTCIHREYDRDKSVDDMSQKFLGNSRNLDTIPEQQSDDRT